MKWNVIACESWRTVTPHFYMAASPAVAAVSGEYFYQCAPDTPSPQAQDDAMASKLWTASERLAALVQPAP